jgi:CBS domain-containing protein
MTRDLIMVSATDPVSRARDLMIALGVHALPVVSDSTTVGIVTSADLVDDWPEDFEMAEVMTPWPYTIDIEATVGEAAEEMMARGVHHLLVVEAGSVVGILSTFDLLEVLVPTDRSEART